MGVYVQGALPVSTKTRTLELLGRMRANSYEDQATVEAAKPEDLVDVFAAASTLYAAMAKLKGVKVKV